MYIFGDFSFSHLGGQHQCNQHPLPSFLLQQLKINIIVIVNILIVMIADFFLLIIVTIIVMITIIIIIIIGGRYLSTQAANLGVQASGKSSLL